MSTGLTIGLLSIVLILAFMLYASVTHRKSSARFRSARSSVGAEPTTFQNDPLFDDLPLEEPEPKDAFPPEELVRKEPVINEYKMNFDEPISTEQYSEIAITSSSEQEENRAATETDITPELIILNVMAREHGTFSGPHVLQALLSMGLRFGDMSVFHRYDTSHANGAKGELLFSVASAVEPGTFDLDSMGSFLTPGLTLFLPVPGPSDPLSAYDLMIETADKLAERLGGEVMDVNRMPLQTEVIEESRLRINQLSRIRSVDVVL